MVDEQELQAWREALAGEPRVRDVSTLTGQRRQDLPWRWRTLVENLASTADRVLDLGTGGGEVLASLADALPAGTLATAERLPDRANARGRLTPLGIEVLAHDPGISGARLPLPDGSVDLVLCRHAAYAAADVARVLVPGGAFLTEQVGGDDGRELLEAFGLDPSFPHVTLENAVHGLIAAGFTVERSAAFHGDDEFDDVPSLLRRLRRVPRSVPGDLAVDRHRDVLESVHARCQDGPLAVTRSRFLVLARTPSTPEAGRTDFAELLEDAPPEVPRV